LDSEASKPDFWQQKDRAVELSQKLNDLKEEVKIFEKLSGELEDISNLQSLGEEGLEKEINLFEAKLAKEEFRIFLSGKYDRGSAILSIYAGTGGQDAQDWATMLLRMYDRYCAFKGFQFKVLNQSFGEAGGPEGRIGTKSVSAEVKGLYAFGFLKKETGVHRLVRISPFSAKSLRHTSFALVEVLPVIEKEDEIEVKPDDLKIDFYRASGPGGQNVNKRETSVRITHLPSNAIVSCQSERTQAGNRKKAMQMLFSKLYQIREEKEQKELMKAKGDKISVSWGNQIRSYIVHPYKMAKDLRTGIEVSDVESVLDGNIDKFINEEIKL